MSYERRTDPVTGEPYADDTRVVERETYVEREQPVDRGYVPPAQPAAPQVNVNSGPPTYREPVVTNDPGPLYYVRRVVSLLFGILVVLIGLRILLLLLVANEGNTIVDFILSATEPFVAPFRGIFSLNEVTAGQSTLDVAAVVALVGWLLIYLLIMAILRIGDRDRV
jgi:uncharacterized protein YggT (Ycf19 family)